MARPLIIAIDGPSASGKSAVGRALAERLGYTFVDTGLMYRAITWAALQRGIPVDDGEALAKLSREAKIELIREPTASPTRVRIDGQDVTAEMRGPEVEARVSLVARVGAVRQSLVEQQRALASHGPVVMAGRDIGTVVLPQANLKLYLTASVETRARRRYLELRAQEPVAEYETVLADTKIRDTIDSERSVSPLRPAEDAIIIDTEGLSLDQVVAQIEALMAKL